MNINPNAIYYVSHSGGKDSQAMYAHLSRLVPAEQIVVVHADLGKVEWDGVQDHIRDTIDHDLHVVRAGKTFFDMVRRRAATRPDAPAWPSSQYRQCTSDLKRGPIEKFIRADMKARGVTESVNCMGLRAAESTARAKRPTWRPNKRLSKAGRTVHDWLPIHDWSDKLVFGQIAAAGQKPFHAYSRNKRLSCVFCIMACDNDILHGADQRPDLVEEIDQIERDTGSTMFPTMGLKARIAAARQAAAERAQDQEDSPETIQDG